MLQLIKFNDFKKHRIVLLTTRYIHGWSPFLFENENKRILKQNRNCFSHRKIDFYVCGCIPLRNVCIFVLQTCCRIIKDVSENKKERKATTTKDFCCVSMVKSNSYGWRKQKKTGVYMIHV